MPTPPAPPAGPAPKPPLVESKGRILAVKLMEASEKFEIDSAGPQGNFANVIWYGLAPVLLVEEIVPKVQSTIFQGPRLYMLQNDVGIFDQVTGWDKYMAQFLNKEVMWAELTQIPVWPGLRRIFTQPQLPQDPPVAMSNLILLGAGYDPLKGYWVEFAGNFFLGFPLFQPVGGGNYVIAGTNTPANPAVTQQGGQALTATGFDVPAGGTSGKCKC